jgi:uncharacterized protein DUF3619
MNRPDEVAGKVVRLLNHGVESLDAPTRERLAAARTVAMSRYRERPAPVWGLIWAASAIFLGPEHRLHNARYVIAASALVLALAGITYWQTLTPGSDFSEVDLSLLTDDLPINAYLDKGFDTWLKRASR